MNARLPPLTALKAFEAAARHSSFASAAAELNVTPAALSFQIKSLEEHLGAPLFHRLARRVELTEVGRMLSPGCTDGFAVLADAWRQTQHSLDTTRLSITAGPAFTAKWLAPRLFGFVQDHPEIDLRFAASLKLLDLARENIDIAIRFSATPDTEHFSQTLLREHWVPMMTPGLAETFCCAKDLLHAPLVHQDDIQFLNPEPNWAAWFKAAGLTAPAITGPRFSHADHAHDAALSGSGVVLGRLSLAARDLSEGRLVAPFGPVLRHKAQYRLLCPHGAQDKPQVRAFIEWITTEIRDTASVINDFDVINLASEQ